MLYKTLFSNLSSFDMEGTEPGDIISVRMELNDSNTEIAKLLVNENNTLTHIQEYKSPIEFATLTVKQSLALYVKNGVISRYPNDYSPDDPRVHSYVCKLSYEGIKYVARNLDEFAKQFHSGKVTMEIPTLQVKPNKHSNKPFVKRSEPEKVKL